MKNLVKIIALGLVLFAAGQAVSQQTPKTRILFLGKDPDHPHGSHMYMDTCGVLAKCAALTPGIETVVSNGWPKDAKTLDGVKAIVVYASPAAELLMEGPHRGQFDEMMSKGVGLVTIHWASSINQKNFERLGPAWFGHLGGTWVSSANLSFGKSPLKQLLPEHPICRGWTEYEIDDEFYFNPTIKQAKPLLQVTAPKGQKVFVGWVHERAGDGRSFATTLGHPFSNFQREPFRRMIVNAILWSAHVEVPMQGAPVNLTETDLALPAKK